MNMWDTAGGVAECCWSSAVRHDSCCRISPDQHLFVTHLDLLVQLTYLLLKTDGHLSGLGDLSLLSDKLPVERGLA